MPDLNGFFEGRRLRETYGRRLYVPAYRQEEGDGEATEVTVEDERKAEVLALVSPITEDRYGTRFSAEGWNLDGFRKTGVVTFSHMQSGTEIGMLPVAVPREVWSEREVGLKQISAFAVDDSDEVVRRWARSLFDWLGSKLIRGWSHWLDPRAWEEADGTKVERPLGVFWWEKPGRLYTKQELMEDGPVVVPANPDAATLRILDKDLADLERSGAPIAEAIRTQFRTRYGFDPNAGPAPRVGVSNFPGDAGETLAQLGIGIEDGRIVDLLQTREGKILSTKNVAKIRSAAADSRSVAKKLGEVLADSGNADDDDKDGKDKESPKDKEKDDSKKKSFVEAASSARSLISATAERLRAGSGSKEGANK